MLPEVLLSDKYGDLEFAFECRPKGLTIVYVVSLL